MTQPQSLPPTRQGTLIGALQPITSGNLKVFGWNGMNTSGSPALRVGDLVIWSPTDKPGLWRVVAVGDGSYWKSLNYSDLERRLLQNVPATPGGASRPRFDKLSETPGYGKVRLVWVGGWSGFDGARRPVVVPAGDVRLAGEMEALAVATLDE